MRTTSPITTPELLAELSRLTDERERPPLDYKNSFRVDSFSVADCEDLAGLIHITEKLAEKTLPKQKKHAQARMKQWHLIMANLCHATAVNEWVGISGKKSAFNSGGHLANLGLQFNATKQILEVLQESGLIEKQEGKKYSNEPITNQYYPTKSLQRFINGCSLFAENPRSFDQPLLSINEPEPGYEGFQWTKDHPDSVVMSEINEFARTQSWACKSAIKQVFKHTPFQSGRLITPFQNLHNKRYKIRVNTLINGNPITEVDFNANHLRLFLAFNQTDVIGGKDAYAAIVDESGLDRDEVVKRCVNVALNTADENLARSSLHLQGITDTQYSKFSEAFSKLYPHLDIHAKQSLEAMQCEGMILREVVHKGASEGILALPVHDAVAVEAKHREWAVEAMTASWECWVGQWHSNAKASVK